MNSQSHKNTFWLHNDVSNIYNELVYFYAWDVKWFYIVDVYDFQVLIVDNWSELVETFLQQSYSICQDYHFAKKRILISDQLLTIYTLKMG